MRGGPRPSCEHLSCYIANSNTLATAEEKSPLDTDKTATPTVQPFRQRMCSPNWIQAQSTYSISINGLTAQGKPGRDQDQLKSTLIHTSLCAQTFHPHLSHFTSSPFTPPYASKRSSIPVVLGKLQSQDSNPVSGVFFFFHEIIQDWPLKVLKCWFGLTLTYGGHVTYNASQHTCEPEPHVWAPSMVLTCVCSDQDTISSLQHSRMVQVLAGIFYPV